MIWKPFCTPQTAGGWVWVFETAGLKNGLVSFPAIYPHAETKLGSVSHCILPSVSRKFLHKVPFSASANCMQPSAACSRHVISKTCLRMFRKWLTKPKETRLLHFRAVPYLLQKRLKICKKMSRSQVQKSFPPCKKCSAPAEPCTPSLVLHQYSTIVRRPVCCIPTPAM